MLPSSLQNGYRRFREDRYAAEAARYCDLADGQAPETMVIACADSRVDPSTIFAAAPGELFVVRNVAALVPSCESGEIQYSTSAALEFAVTALKVRNIVVMGHGQCGGVAASLAAGEGAVPGQFIGPWVELLAPARDRIASDTAIDTAEARQRALEWQGIQLSIANLKSFAFVAEAVAKGELSLFGAWFSIGDGALHAYSEADGTFRPVED